MKYTQTCFLEPVLGKIGKYTQSPRENAERAAIVTDNLLYSKVKSKVKAGYIIVRSKA